MHLYLIRHGQSYVNLQEWENGNLDEGLTELGQRQAALLAEWLPRHVPNVHTIYTSTMRRALETAQAVCTAYAMEPVPDDRLREIGNNRLDHSPWPNHELPQDFPDYWGTARPFSPVVLPAQQDHLSETYMHFRTRVGIFIEEMAANHQGENILAICHGGVIDSAFDHIFNVGPWRRCEIWNHNTSITQFERVEHPGREVWRLHCQNRIDHLARLDAV